jgi:hypothetical protein
LIMSGIAFAQSSSDACPYDPEPDSANKMSRLRIGANQREDLIDWQKVTHWTAALIRSTGMSAAAQDAYFSLGTKPSIAVSFVSSLLTGKE